MTKAELLAIISTARTSSSSSFAAAVVVEQTTGPLKLLVDDQAECDVLYDIADDYIVPHTVDLVKARIGLTNALFIENQRGLTASAQAAITALDTYQAAPYYGSAAATSWAAAINVSTP